MEERTYTSPTLAERFEIALEHARMLVEQKGERTGIAESRKHMAWYLHGIRGGAAARNAVMAATSIADIERIFAELSESNCPEN